MDPNLQGLMIDDLARGRRPLELEDLIGRPLKARRDGARKATSDSWTVVSTGSAGAASRSLLYPIASQPTVTPLLMTGTSTAGSQYTRATQTLSPGIVARKLAISVPIFVPDYTKVASITVSVSYDGFASTSWSTVYTPEFSGKHVVGLSARIVQGLAGGLQYTTGYAAGTETAFTSLRYQVTWASGVTGAVAFGDPFVNVTDRAQILFTVDDGQATIMRQLDSSLPWSPWEYAVSKNVPLTFFLIYSLIGTANYLAASDIDQILAAGHCVCPHGATSLASLADDTTRRADVAANIAGLAALGVPDRMLRASYAYPNGVFEVSAGDTSIMQILRDNGIRSARTASRRASIPNHVAPHRQYHLPILGHYTDIGGGGETTTTSLAKMRDLVETGGTGIYTFHKFVNGTPVDTLEIQFSEWRTLIDAAAAYREAGVADVITMLDLATLYYGSAPTSNTP